MLGRLPMATDPMIMSSTLIESQKSIIYTPTTTLLTLYSIFARLLTILQNIKQSFWTLISLQYRFFTNYRHEIQNEDMIGQMKQI